MILAEDFSPESVMKKIAYAYGGFFIAHFRDTRFIQSPKGAFFRGILLFDQTKFVRISFGRKNLVKSQTYIVSGRTLFF